MIGSWDSSGLFLVQAPRLRVFDKFALKKSSIRVTESWRHRLLSREMKNYFWNAPHWLPAFAVKDELVDKVCECITISWIFLMCAWLHVFWLKLLKSSWLFFIKVFILLYPQLEQDWVTAVKEAGGWEGTQGVGRVVEEKHWGRGWNELSGSDGEVVVNKTKSWMVNTTDPFY